ncbi:MULTISPECIES: conjugal transfer protein TraG N-terminal domain-containing protein [unclassified Janthinobacterium]|uniref:conjugal transfer protein TraG N-terminal domain-containing protein n=1 Tax=unclassified Janthinobacterium TaxID=2610881 RepID=UPI00088A2F54|nr:MULTISPECIES: conjugal transfer protein TraG N-terminal domain-containing protein [unclassified Janthinobacterium]SDA53858.1 conjugal transfer mating pair stabilization protein TraG [Janthinobacterium sp. 551a]SFB65972.1 conjugal transfer mating pair stabilization protein TraG [Janthinobacterium sp. 344]
MWEIFAYQNSDSLYGLMNAVAAMVGANTYRNALGIVAVCGFVAALVGYAFAPEKMVGWKWLASVVLVFSVLVVPKVTVGIVDKTGGSAEVFVDNVPFGLAVLASLTSTVGNSLTELEETAMQVIPGPAGMPDKLSYQNNGLMFGSRLVRETSKVVFQSPYFRNDLINFLHQCTMFDLASGYLSPEAFATSGDVWALMGDPNPARFTGVTNAAGTSEVLTCPQAYTKLSAKMPAEVQRIQGTLAFRMNPTLPGAVASALIADQIQQAYLKAKIADASASAADIIRQNALINAVNDTSLLAGQKDNDPATMLLAVGRAQAVVQTNAAWINAGKIAEQALPVIRNVVEVVAYAMFPLLILLLMLANGKDTVAGFKNYASVLIWIQLWPPLYAILNYAATMYAMRDLAAAASVGNGVNALSLTTSSTIFSSAISGEAVVGYMTISIPFIAWAALKRMENFGTALVDGMRLLQGNVTTATNSAATGNVSMGNVSMDQMTLAPVRSSPFFRSRQNDFSGNTYTGGELSGITAGKAFANEGPVSKIVDAKITQQHVAAARKSASAAKSEAIAATNDKAAVLSDALTHSQGTSGIQNASKGTNRASTEGFGQRTNELRQVAENVAKATGATEQQVATVAFGGAVEFKPGIPGVGSVGISARGAKDYVASIDQQLKEIKNKLSSEEVTKFKEWGEMLAKNTSLLNSVISDHRNGQEIAARLTNSVSRSERADATLREQEEYSRTVSGAFERGELMSIDLAKNPKNIDLFEALLSHGESSASAQILFDSHLGSIAKSPIIPSAKSNLPNSFKAVREIYHRDKSDLSLNQDLIKIHKNNKLKVNQKPSGKIGGSGEVADAGGTSLQREGKSWVEKEQVRIKESPSPLQKEISNKYDALDREVNQSKKDFYKSTGIKENPSGHIATDKSLFGNANEQVTEDPDVVAKHFQYLKRKAKDNLNKLLNK